jgi:membrane protein YqaA with SNARE-associated domain
MKILSLSVGSALKSLEAILLGLGAPGVLVIALLDAAILPLPGGLDAVVMTLSHLNRGMMPLYVLAAIAGSTLGCLVPYWIGRKMGEAALGRVGEKRRARVSELIARYDMWAMLVGALLPPPFPFKLFLITAGVFRMRVWRFLMGLTAGRAVRFILEGWMAVRYGEQAAALFKMHYPKIGLGIAAAILVILIINIIRNRRHTHSLGEFGRFTTKNTK